jgi:flagellar basal-body rod modification protein FlgD
MEIKNVYNAQMTGTADTKKQSQLSVDDFLKIMAAEIQNQNPTGESSGGGSKTDYLTQLAQFTTLEQMNKISDGISQLNLLSQMALIGKMVKIYGPEQDTRGIVEKVKFFNNQAYLQVGGTDYPIGLLMEVEESQEINQLEDLLLEVSEKVETSLENKEQVEELYTEEPAAAEEGLIRNEL